MNICFLICLALICAGCSSSSQWSVQHLQGSQPQFKSSKMCYYSPDKYNGVDLEILRSTECTHMFLIVHSQSVACCEENEHSSYITLSSDAFQVRLKAIRHQGGQRLLLPSLVYPLIISTLKSNKPLLVKMGGYSAEISPKTFVEKYKKWQHPPNFILPFRFPI